MMMFGDLTGMTMERWLDEAACLSMVCTKMIDSSSEMDQTVGMRGVGMAAATIWRTTNGEPSWGKLDVEELRRATREAGMQPHWQDLVLVVVCSFYGFLEHNGLVPWEQTRPIIDALTPFVEPAADRLMAGVAKAEPEHSATSMLN